MRGFISFFGKENGRTHYLYVAEEHPILDNFSFEKGFYLIDTNVPIEKNSPQYWSTGGEDNPHNFHKFIELENKITITPQNKEKIQNQYNQQVQNINTSNKIIESDNSAKSKNAGSTWLVAGGLLVIGIALIIGYLLGKNRKN